MMQIRGNYYLLFIIEIVTGILTFSLCLLYGDMGLSALILFFIGMSLIMKTKVDEREVQLLYKSGTAGSFVIGAAMAYIYFSLPSLNWFYSLISIVLITRGISGLIVFSTEKQL
jgi:hypothetical protein